MELLRTDRLALRAWAEADLAAFFDLYSRDEVTRWLGPQPRRPLTTVEDARDRLDRWRRHAATLAPPLGLWAMVPLAAAPQLPLGTALLLPLSDSDGPTEEVEIGWHLHPDHQGRGLATEAAAALLQQAAIAGWERVLALTDLDNAPSQAVARRLGMRDDGVTDRWFGLTTRQFRWSVVPV